MLFPTIDFAIFFVVVLAIYWFLRPHPIAWKLFLIGASYFFYSYWDEPFVLLLGGSTIGNWVLGELTYRSLRDGERTAFTRVLIGLDVAGNLALLGWFKYYGFFSTEIVHALEDIGLDVPLPLLRVTLPVGISFFTFQGISYVIDISRAQIQPLSFLNFAVFQSFFAHLVAGPIVRASELGPQLDRPLEASEIDTTAAFTLIFIGLFKKVVVSSYLSQEIVDPVFAVPSEHSALEILIATYAYAIQIFADFSGYTDIAIGCALLLGFKFPQNFNRPYSSTTLQDFWRRWHMTLSRWLRDYLYIPLGGGRGTRVFVARNLMITFALGGLWHGAAMTFVVWGLIHGTWLVVERFVPGYLGPEDASRRINLRNAVHWAITFHVVCLGWIFFRAESFDLAGELIGRIFTSWGSAPLVTPMVLFTIFGMLALQFVPGSLTDRWQRGFARLAPAPQALALAFGLVLIDALGPEGVAPFIYFQF